MATVSGTCDARFAEVRELLQGFVASGEELGASIVVDLDGQTVMDLWAGYTDADRQQAWQRDTICNVFSCTKLVTSLAVLMLVDRGLVSLDDSVARHWPEFGANGKEAVLIRHVLAHSSGVSGWDEPMLPHDLYDFDAAAAKLARQPPWWQPGSVSGYHTLTYGFLIGQLVRCVTGKTLRQFVADEIAGPLGADFQIGACEQDWPRVADVLVSPAASQALTDLDPASFSAKARVGILADTDLVNTPGWRRAELGAVNGHGNARSLVRILSALTLGGATNGTRLLSQETIDLALEEQTNSLDVVLGYTVRWGNGVALVPAAIHHWLPKSGRVCFWGGFGGSYVIMDLDRRLTIAYTMNYADIIGGSTERGSAYGRAIYRAMGL
ncbi:hypothetical protein CDD82_1863 [Ophiocordyceps australis]|uniref:Beta-lactamase-related domain-containing protein n=1 Tax=Ophiocordyceps australis TaxID=1399860 RepID=A0A2C5ZU28_9HYPO|nr:hypothetical protein CDD82_1863 [Ophiocordyceps australis]